MRVHNTNNTQFSNFFKIYITLVNLRLLIFVVKASNLHVLSVLKFSNLSTISNSLDIAIFLTF